MNSAWALSRCIRCSLRTDAGHSHWWIFQTALRHRQILSAINFTHVLRMFTNLSCDPSFLNIWTYTIRSHVKSTCMYLTEIWRSIIFRRHYLIFQETLKKISINDKLFNLWFGRLTIGFTVNIMFFIWNKLLHIKSQL